MPRLQADADPTLWVPVTGFARLAGPTPSKVAIRMLLTQANRAMGVTERPGSGVLAWSMSQAAPFLMRRAAGRVLVWVWKADPELVVVMAQVQEATPQLRAARAMMPMEYDDTERSGTRTWVSERSWRCRSPETSGPRRSRPTRGTPARISWRSPRCAPTAGGSALSSAASTTSPALCASTKTSTLGESPTVLRIDPAPAPADRPD